MAADAFTSSRLLTLACMHANGTNGSIWRLTRTSLAPDEQFIRVGMEQGLLGPCGRGPATGRSHGLPDDSLLAAD